MASTLKSNALIALADEKIYLNEATATFDTILESLINSVSAMFDNEIRPGSQVVEATDSTLTLSGNGRKYLYLPRWPVTSIATIKEDGVTMVSGEDDDYLLYGAKGYLKRMGCKVWAEGDQNIVLTSVVAGYTAAATVGPPAVAATMPDDLRLGCMKQVAFELQQYKRKEWGETSRSLPDGSFQRLTVGILPDVEEILAKYRRIRV
jgi:hypothetical protein